MEQVLDIADATSSASTASDTTKYLTFVLDGEEYGLDVLNVREIIGLHDITQVPQTTDFMEGVINLRGKVIPVIDLRTKFRLPRAAYDDQTCIIVVDVGELMGIIVDTVCEVYEIRKQDIEPPPRLGGGANTDFLTGMGKVKGDVKMLLDMDKVMTGESLVNWDYSNSN